jgi:hypothetical protein
MIDVDLFDWDSFKDEHLVGSGFCKNCLPTVCNEGVCMSINRKIMMMLEVTIMVATTMTAIKMMMKFGAIMSTTLVVLSLRCSP